MSVTETSDPLFDPEALPSFVPSEQPEDIGRLADYRLRKMLGKGGMGVVFLAEDLRLRRPVALKMLLPAGATNPVARERFLREARAAAGLNSDHTVAIFQVGEAPLANGETVPYLAMELLRGMTLEEYLKSIPKMPPHIVARIGREVALGLSAAHGLGLVHRDIKPGNIWLENPTPERPQGRVKVLDFGLVQPQNEEHELTAKGDILGTPQYMSPEQVSDLPLDGRSDLFSLGAVLYRCLTGVSPFQRKGVLPTLNAVLTAEPPPPHVIAPEVPENLSLIVMSLLKKEPANRVPSAAQLAAILSATGADASLQMRAITPQETTFSFDDPVTEAMASVSVAAIAAKKPRTPLVAGISVGVALLLLIVVSAILTWPKSPTKPNEPLASVTPTLTEVEPPHPVTPVEQTQPAPPIRPTLSSPPVQPQPPPVQPQPPPALEPIVKLEEFHELLKAKNPQLAVLPTAKVEAEGITELSFSDGVLIDLTPLARLPKLRRLNLSGAKKRPNALKDLSPLRGLPLEYLTIRFTPVSDLGPLRGMNLKSLELSEVPVSDLGPLAGMPLQNLWLNHVPVSDLGPLAETQLGYLKTENVRFTDLKPLQKLPLTQLVVFGNPDLQDITPLRGLKLTECRLNGSSVTNLSPLVGMPLQHLSLPMTKITTLELVRHIKSLRYLDITRTEINDLRPLADLKELTALNINDTQVEDISPLGGLNIQNLAFRNTPIKDLTPLLDLPALRSVYIPNLTDKHKEIFRKMKLETINNNPAKRVLMQ